MKTIMSLFIALLVLSLPLQAAEGVISVESKYSVNDTADRFENFIKAKGLKRLARIDHAKNAASAQLTLRPTQLILFGNPKIGTPLMNCAQTVAIDLPQKALFWEDESGKVWLSYNDPVYLKQRHEIKGCDPIIEKIRGVLGALARAAAGAPKQ
jgi:uncharacterized protein (DUF302 family)